MNLLFLYYSDTLPMKITLDIKWDNSYEDAYQGKPALLKKALAEKVITVKPVHNDYL